MTVSRTTQCLLWAGIAASLSGCFGSFSQTSKATKVLPDWVSSPPKSSTHIYGVGSAPKIDNLALAFAQAEQNGNAQIAQQLKTQVSQVSTQNTQVTSNNGNEQVAKIQTAYTQIATAPIELEQAVNEQRFAGEKYVYALQSIDRARIVTRLKQAIAAQDSSIKKLAAGLTTDASQTAATQDWPIYMRLIPAFAQRQSYVEELQLYSTERQLAGRASDQVEQIEIQLSQALQYYGMDASQTNQANALASALSEYGFTAKSPAVFRLSSQTSQHSEIQSGRSYVFEEGTLALYGPDNTPLASWTVSARGIAKDQKRATEMATNNWSKQAINAMFTWLTRIE
ncbi:LPP20 family lipoprotein [Marinomonas sp. THO17]|uniref:LPP20 family lipoprotein n=1 Tax=Marinomonas sp. THO17 TaxID=3149048 RepID=UPI00336BBE3B